MKKPSYIKLTAPLFTLSALAACSSPESTSSTLLRERVEHLQSQDGTPDLKSRVVRLEASGELCPEPFIQPMGESEALFGTFSASDLPISPSSSKTCTVTMQLEVPSGYQMGFPEIEWRGFVVGSAAAATAEQSHSFIGGPSYALTSPQFESDEPFRLTDKPTAGFSPTCDGTSTVTLQVVLDLSSEQSALQAASEHDRGQFQLEMFIINTREREGTDYRRCGATEIERPFSPAGQACGGESERQCEEGLLCDYVNPNGRSGRYTGEGTCVDPTTASSERLIGETCGGVRNHLCEADSVCWRQDEIAQDPNSVGHCRAVEAGENLECKTGSPQLECAPPLVCWLYNHTCALAAGHLGDPCGEPGMTKCGEELYCSPSAFYETFKSGICRPREELKDVHCGSQADRPCTSLEDAKKNVPPPSP